MLVAQSEFLAKNPRRVQAFFDDYYRFLQYALNPRNRDKMIVAAKMQNVPAHRFKPGGNRKTTFIATSRACLM